MTDEKRTYLSEKQKKALALEAGISGWPERFDADQLFALWMVVGRMYGDAIRKEPAS